MKIKSAELIGDRLNWAVAKARGHESLQFRGQLCEPTAGLLGGIPNKFMPTTSWEQCGNLIKDMGHVGKFGLAVSSADCQASLHIKHELEQDFESFFGQGPTPLIATSRCFVQFKLGDEVDIPDELMQVEETHVPRERGG